MAVTEHPLPRIAVPDLLGGRARWTPDTRPVLACTQDGWGLSQPLFCWRGKAAVRSGRIRQAYVSAKDEIRFSWIHHTTSSLSTASWIPPFSSLRLSGACCSQQRASTAAEPQGRLRSLVERRALPALKPFVHSNTELSRRTHRYVKFHRI